MERFVSCYGPKRGVGEESADKLGVQGVAGFVGLDVGQERQASQRQVANEVQGLVPAKFIGKAQGPVHDAIVGEHDSVFKRAAANQTHGLERLDIAFEAKRTGASKQVAEGLRAD